MSTCVENWRAEPIIIGLIGATLPAYSIARCTMRALRLSDGVELFLVVKFRQISLISKRASCKELLAVSLLKKSMRV